MKTMTAALLLFMGLLFYTAHAEDTRYLFEQRLETLKEEWERSRDTYKEALKEKRELVEKDIKKAEKLLEKEQDEKMRESLLDALKNLRAERAAVNDKIRIINAGDVVKFSNGRDKILSTITGQTPA